MHKIIFILAAVSLFLFSTTAQAATFTKAQAVDSLQHHYHPATKTVYVKRRSSQSFNYIVTTNVNGMSCDMTGQVRRNRDLIVFVMEATRSCYKVR